ncbi:hypothetical protein HKX48_000926 [Thoreauomyces humboldtii]|nr:hypothetical protein HKX48_000926 [Thoreauomyces humboldtii]
MGNQVSVQRVELQPLASPVHAFDAKFCSQQITTLLLKHKRCALSGEDFNVRDPYTNELYFYIKGRVFTIREQKNILDLNKQPILVMKEKLLSYRMKQSVFRGKDTKEKMFMICERFTFIRPKLSVKFVNEADQEVCELICKGSLVQKRCTLYLDRGCKGKNNRVIVGEIAVCPTQFMNSGESFVLRVCPGMDMVLATTMVMAYEELEEKKAKKQERTINVNL